MDLINICVSFVQLLAVKPPRGEELRTQRLREKGGGGGGGGGGKRERERERERE